MLEQSANDRWGNKSLPHLSLFVTIVTTTLSAPPKRTALHTLLPRVANVGRPRSSSQKTAVLSSFARDGTTNPMHCIARHTTLYRPTLCTVSAFPLHCVTDAPKKLCEKPYEPFRVMPLQEHSDLNATAPLSEGCTLFAKTLHPYRENPAGFGEGGCRGGFVGFYAKLIFIIPFLLFSHLLF